MKLETKWQLGAGFGIVALIGLLPVPLMWHIAGWAGVLALGVTNVWYSYVAGPLLGWWGKQVWEWRQQVILKAYEEHKKTCPNCNTHPGEAPTPPEQMGGIYVKRCDCMKNCTKCNGSGMIVSREPFPVESSPTEPKP